MQSSLHLIKNFVTLLLTQKKPVIRQWQNLIPFPVSGATSTISWAVESALYVRIDGCKNRLPLKGALPIVIKGNQAVIKLTAFGIGNITTKTLSIHCLDGINKQHNKKKDALQFHLPSTAQSVLKCQPSIALKSRAKPSCRAVHWQYNPPKSSKKKIRLVTPFFDPNDFE